MKVKDIIQNLEQLAPLHYTEGFDNTGLLVGNLQQEVTGVLVTHDTLEIVIDEAIEKKCNMVVSFHPIIFSGLKKLTGSTYVERVVVKAIESQMAIFAIHTALDNSMIGVNKKICEVLGLKNCGMLIPKSKTIKKLTTYIPLKDADPLRNKLFEVGGGSIGNYENCSFSTEGTGSFKPRENANPTIGKIGKTHFENEVQISMTFPAHLEGDILSTLFKNHPYEEVAYEVITLDNSNQNIGMGMTGELDSPIGEKEFLALVKEKMQTGCIKHSALLGKKVRKVAVLGGSGAFAIEAAKRSGADVFITADLKYHEFYKAENQMVIMDIGHFESERFTKNLIYDFLKKKIPNFAIALSESDTNPIKYF
ncbi:Nif3-like dinuclear metal center hexameric protein [Allomuricauda sp. SCSIO 65647]|uniref:Nif3-like dinuclear metal center hexameric protein n=1 Tax=Allomuricauda sp. SCSIO 65647 TaxID=2908843 RepID=UPI001F0108F1|nr:Nif3-like dinuclear metal center hexameric protein [Muricauda sp. SCSIO 65647]UJH68125.1 Nif3-like dinuclear metal center hexameric protein [Muricauda sp. SCSIO 65647]